jgi:hypothetical protein
VEGGGIVGCKPVVETGACGRGGDGLGVTGSFDT